MKTLIEREHIGTMVPGNRLHYPSIVCSCGERFLGVYDTDGIWSEGWERHLQSLNRRKAQRLRLTVFGEWVLAAVVAVLIGAVLAWAGAR